jgi:hypothetical protein
MGILERLRRPTAAREEETKADGCDKRPHLGKNSCRRLTPTLSWGRVQSSRAQRASANRPSAAAPR